jgi:hypothetical protein
MKNKFSESGDSYIDLTLLPHRTLPILPKNRVFGKIGKIFSTKTGCLGVIYK